MPTPIYIPQLNPIRLVEAGHTYIKLFADNIPWFEEYACYLQPFNNPDTIKFQLSIPYDAQVTFTAGIYDSSGNLAGDFISTTGVQIGSYAYYEFSLNLTGMVEGIYQVRVNTGDVYLASEPIHIKPVHENTISFKYSHDLNDFGVLFMENEQATPHEFMFRVHAGFKSDGFNPANESESYINDDYNVVQLESKPYFTQKLLIGDSRGVPWWVADKVNRIFSCTSINFNGRHWAKTNKSKLEPVNEDLYPLSGWTIDLMPAVNNYSDVAGAGDYNQDYNNDFNNLTI